MNGILCNNWIITCAYLVTINFGALSRHASIIHTIRFGRIIDVTRGWHSIECITHAGRAAPSRWEASHRNFLHFLTLWPWPLTFSPNIICWARYHGGLSRSLASLAILVSAVLFSSCEQTDRITESQKRMIAILTRLRSAWVIIPSAEY